MTTQPKVTIEVMQSQFDPKYYALSIDDIRHGPDAGPWSIIHTFKVDAQKLKDATEAALSYWRR